jgi:hypothetical protein
MNGKSSNNERMKCVKELNASVKERFVHNNDRTYFICKTS